MPLSPDYGVTLSAEEFEQRFITLHKQLFASGEFVFNDVATHVYKPPQGAYQVDHSFLFDGQQWHLFYVTGDLTRSNAYSRCMAASDWEGASRNSVESGVGHAVGGYLFELQYAGIIEPPVQGGHDIISRSNGWAFSHDGRYGMIYGVRGRNGFVGFSLMWSDDLKEWSVGDRNPIFGPPEWALTGATCKDIHLVQHDGVWLLYYITMDREGYCCVALKSTTDWRSFEDHGCVFRSAPMLRGTMGIESVAVVQRNGMWHMFFTYGPGLWHAVSPTPMRFVRSRGTAFNVGTGFYFMGPFHATEVIEDHDGQWWITTDRKEETRRLNRAARRLCYRGTYEDEKTLEEGLYLSRLHWENDQPILEMPTRNSHQHQSR